MCVMQRDEDKLMLCTSRLSKARTKAAHLFIEILESGATLQKDYQSAVTREKGGNSIYKNVFQGRFIYYLVFSICAIAHVGSE